MTSDDLFIISPLDQPLPADPTEFLDAVDRIIRQALAEHDPAKALRVCKNLKMAQQMSGLVLAKALYLIKENWDQLAPEDDEQPDGHAKFSDVVFEAVGLHPHTVDRYVNLWRMFESGMVPEQIEYQLKQRNVKDLIPVANALSQGYEINSDQWDALAQAPDYSSVSKIVREEIKGAPPRQGALILTLDEDGLLWAFQDNDRFPVGALEVDTDSEVVQKAINRIVQNAGILRS